MADKKKVKKKENDEEEEPKAEKTKLTRKGSKPEAKVEKKSGYATERQPQWVTNPPDGPTVELESGQRAFMYTEKGYVLLANKDWEKEGVGTLPGKTIRIKFNDMDKLVGGYLREYYEDYFKENPIELEGEGEADDADDEEE